jgi:hypothetical protein
MLRKSADTWRAFAETASVDEVADDWIAACNNCARSLIFACAIDGDAKRLPEAVDWARRSVEVANRATDPEKAVEGADTLCVALTELGEREHDRGMAEEAVQAGTWALGLVRKLKLKDAIEEIQEHLSRAKELLALLK